MSRYFALLILVLTPTSCFAQNWEPLFDGKTLTGWQALPGGEWSVVDGAIIGLQEKSETRHGMLISNKEYSDFEVKLKYKSLEGNSGFYFRAKRVDHAVSVKGFQAEVDSRGNGQGGLYETLGRAWVTKTDKQFVNSFYKPKEWNEMSVRAVGRHVVVKVNGVQTAELIHDPGNLSGHFGLQLHGRQNMNVQFKDIFILDLSQSTNAASSHLTENIHDKTIPSPPVKSGLSSNELQKKSKLPSGATMLFDGKNLNYWKNKHWQINNHGSMQSNKGNQISNINLGDGRYHVEWRIVDTESKGNSGVYIHSKYEVQVFNSFNNHSPIYPDGQASAIYGQYPPAFNVSKKAGEWEFYDIDFVGPKYNQDGSLMSKAKMTVYHNGIRVHHNAELTGPTGHKKRPEYKTFSAELPLLLQDHGDKVEYRNIWFMPLK